MNKKGFTLVELIVSITLLSIVLVFLLGTLVTLKKEENNLGVETELAVNQAIVSKNINSDVIKFGGLSSVTCSTTLCTLTFIDESVKTVELSNSNKTLEYKSSNKVDFKRTLPDEVNYNDFELIELSNYDYGDPIIIKININGYLDYGIEIVDY